MSRISEKKFIKMAEKAISKRRFWKELKRDPYKENKNHDIFGLKFTDEEWICGYRRWKKQLDANSKRTNS